MGEISNKLEKYNVALQGAEDEFRRVVEISGAFYTTNFLIKQTLPSSRYDTETLVRSIGILLFFVGFGAWSYYRYTYQENKVKSLALSIESLARQDGTGQTLPSFAHDAARLRRKKAWLLVGYFVISIFLYLFVIDFLPYALWHIK